jgi:stage IV sporulation protein FB
MFSVRQLWQSDKHYVIGLLGFALLVMLLPLRWLVAGVIAAIIHECGHYVSVYLLGGSIRGIKLQPSGAVMEASGISPKAELICLLAGPLAGLLPIITMRIFPTLALCGIIQSAYNMLPLFPLDGGRILRLVIILSGGTEHTFRTIENIVCILLSVFCLYLQMRVGVFLMPILVVFLLRKTPCKPR